MEVRVLLFSMLRERIGSDCIVVEISEPADGNALLDAIESRYPDIGPFRGLLRMAVNRTYVNLDASLKQGDEVALISPVSGG